MKKFQFSLQKLKDFREQELGRQKNILSIMQGELRTIEESAEQLRRRVAAESEALTVVSAQGIPAYEISLRKRYIVTLQQEIHAKEAQAIKKKAEIEAQLSVVVEATKDVKTLEKLEEKQLEEYKAMETKENEQFIEEFVSNAAVRSSG